MNLRYENFAQIMFPHPEYWINQKKKSWFSKSYHKMNESKNAKQSDY